MGVREPATIFGANIGRFNRLVRLARMRLHGAIDLVDYSVEVDGKELESIEVKPAKILVATQEGYFRRVGDREELLTAQRLVQMMTEVPNHVAAIAALGETIAGQSH